jgi:hypothetical protein
VVEGLVAELVLQRNFAARVTTTPPSWNSSNTLPAVPMVTTTPAPVSVMIWVNRSRTGRVTMPSPVLHPVLVEMQLRLHAQHASRPDLGELVVAQPLRVAAGAVGRIWGR